MQNCHLRTTHHVLHDIDCLSKICCLEPRRSVGSEESIVVNVFTFKIISTNKGRPFW